MSERQRIARAAAEGLRALEREAAGGLPVLVGFDGFVDSIIAVVNKRHDLERYEPVPTIEQFGRKILAAAGQSSNYELVTKLQKLGGNGPIMANALSAAGLGVTYIGALGYPEPHPVFAEFAQRAKVYSVTEPGYTDALEFEDGKLLLGKYESVSRLDWSAVEAVVGASPFEAMVREARLVAMVNWTMVPLLETIWRHMIDAVLPGLDGSPRKLVFVDLADPEKRTRQDLCRALDLCRQMNRYADVVLGVNLKESSQVAEAVGVEVPADPEPAIETTARGIREALDLHGVVVHPRRGAAAAVRAEDGVASARFDGPFTARPRLSTGAGDNFNAGFCLGLLAKLPIEQCLCAGTATSGFYVREGRSPSLAELASFCDALPAPE